MNFYAGNYFKYDIFDELLSYRAFDELPPLRGFDELPLGQQLIESSIILV